MIARFLEAWPLAVIVTVLVAVGFLLSLARARRLDGGKIDKKSIQFIAVFWLFVIALGVSTVAYLTVHTRFADSYEEQR